MSLKLARGTNQNNKKCTSRALGGLGYPLLSSVLFLDKLFDRHRISYLFHLGFCSFCPDMILL